MSPFRKFFASVQGSAKGILVPEELYRSILAALGSATLVGLVTTILQSVQDHANVIFPNPSTTSLVTMILTLILDLLRRQSHGDKPDPVMVPGTIDIPAPGPVMVPGSDTHRAEAADAA